jgi:hypothetical protein
VARRLDTFPPSRTRRYPWDEWLNGDIWQLVPGEDFEAKTPTLVATARLQAKRLGGTVRTRSVSDQGRDSLVLQFVRGRNG